MATSVTKVGDATVTLVEELILPTSVRWLFPEAEAPYELLEAARPWLEPHFINERGHLLQSIGAFVVTLDGMTAVVDTGVGNDKQRGGGIPEFNMRSGPFLEDFRAAGFDPERVDYVLTTHMHTDHVGWNTRLEDGVWVPTFPNARYVWARPEWEHWSAEAENSEATATLLADSLVPVQNAGLVDLVPADHRVADGLWLEPSHGHTPGHVCVRIASAGVEAVITGDLMHSPIQCAFPDERGNFDRANPEAAKAARHAFLERYADSEVIVLGTHWHKPAAGYVRRDGASFRFEALEPTNAGAEA